MTLDEFTEAKSKDYTSIIDAFTLERHLSPGDEDRDWSFKDHEDLRAATAHLDEKWQAIARTVS